MDRKREERRLNDTKRTVERLRHKFISKYVEGLYGDIFVEAQEFYERVKRDNPTRKDLTKTVEFMNTVNPEDPIPLYYYVRGKTRSKTRKARTTTSFIPREMVLNIPLISQSSTTTSTVSAVSDAGVATVLDASDVGARVCTTSF